MSNLSERGINPSILTRTGRDMAGETLILARYLHPYDASLKSKSKELAQKREGEVSDWDTFGELVSGSLAPEAFYHNGGSADYDISGKRYQRALSEDLIRGIEFDSQWCLGYLMAAHGHGVITAQWLMGNVNLRESQLPKVVERGNGQFDRYNFDLKIHHPENIKDFIEFVKTVPDSIDVFVSSPNWKAIKAVGESDIDRPMTLLYTVNNETQGTTQDAFLRMVDREKVTNSDNRRYGVSLRAEVANPWFLERLKKDNFYMLVYPVDTKNELLRLAKMGVDGVTSNNPRVLQIAELARKFKEKETVFTSREDMELVVGKDNYLENQAIELSDGRRLGFAEYGDPNGEPVMFFHGWPNSRYAGKVFDEAGQKMGMRIISPDRPGYGLSDPKPTRTILDWPADVVELADKLGMEEFSLLGNSGGAPYAAACASEISERVKNVAIVVGLGPINSETTKDMPLIARRGWKKYPHFSSVRKTVSRLYNSHGPRKINSLFLSKADRNSVNSGEVYTDRLRVRDEAFRQGIEWPAEELRIYSKPWGFDLESVKKEVHLFYGGADRTVPASVGTYYQEHLPESDLTIFPGEGHYVARTHAEEILTSLK